jgi:hypothetical protein
LHGGDKKRSKLTHHLPVPFETHFGIFMTTELHICFSCGLSIGLHMDLNMYWVDTAEKLQWGKQLYFSQNMIYKGAVPFRFKVPICDLLSFNIGAQLTET